MFIELHLQHTKSRKSIKLALKAVLQSTKCFISAQRKTSHCHCFCFVVWASCHWGQSC